MPTPTPMPTPIPVPSPSPSPASPRVFYFCTVRCDDADDLFDTDALLILILLNTELPTRASLLLFITSLLLL